MRAAVLDRSVRGLRSSADLRANLRHDHLSGGATQSAAADRSGAVRGAGADRAQAARASARRVPGQARRLPAQLLPPRREGRLEARQARARHRPVHRHLCERQMDGKLFRHPCAGADLVLARHGRVAEGQSRRTREPRRRARPAGPRRRHHGQGDVPRAGRRLRERRSVHLRADQEGAAIMVRDSGASHDGWFWGWFGWNDWRPDWPRAAQATTIRTWASAILHELPRLGASDNQTFASLQNIKGEPGEPLVFLSQTFFLDPSSQSLQARIAQAEDKAAPRPAEALQPGLHRDLLLVGRRAGPRVDRQDAVGDLRPCLGAGRPADRGRPVRDLDQCLGCHSAGGTGLQFDMTAARAPTTS